LSDDDGATDGTGGLPSTVTVVEELELLGAAVVDVVEELELLGAAVVDVVEELELLGAAVVDVVELVELELLDGGVVVVVVDVVVVDEVVVDEVVVDSSSSQSSSPSCFDDVASMDCEFDALSHSSSSLDVVVVGLDVVVVGFEVVVVGFEVVLVDSSSQSSSSSCFEDVAWMDFEFDSLSHSSSSFAVVVVARAEVVVAFSVVVVCPLLPPALTAVGPMIKEPRAMTPPTSAVSTPILRRLSCITGPPSLAVARVHRT
jgi:hypothetical protein